MASLNKVIIMGNLGADPEIRYTQNQTAVTSLRVATTEYRNNPNGERQELTEWHRIVVWGKLAENCKRYLTKGQSILAEGRLQTRSWDDQTGAKRYSTEIVANNVQFLRTGRPSGAQDGFGNQASYGGDSHGHSQSSYASSYDEGPGSFDQGGGFNDFGGGASSNLSSSSESPERSAPSLSDIPF